MPQAILFDATTHRNASRSFGRGLLPPAPQFDAVGNRLPLGPTEADERWHLDQLQREEARLDAALESWVRAMEQDTYRITDRDVYPAGAWS